MANALNQYQPRKRAMVTPQGQLREKIQEHFSLDALKLLCADLGVASDSLSGDTTPLKAQSLIDYCAARGRIPDLITRLKELRPNVNWDVFDVQSPPDVATELAERPNIVGRSDKHSEGDRISAGDMTNAVVAIGRGAQASAIIYEGNKPVSIGVLLGACQKHIESVLYEVRQKYTESLYVERAIEQQLNAFFDAQIEAPFPNCFLIVAPAGSGKTNLLCHLAQERIERQPVLLLLGGNTYLGSDAGLLNAVQGELETGSAQVAFRSPADSLHTLHWLGTEIDRDTLLLIDAINEYEHPIEMRKAIADLLRKTQGKRIKLVVTCRDYYWSLFGGPFWEGATYNGLPSSEDDGEFDESFAYFAPHENKQALKKYLNHYQISGRPVGDAVEQCRHPLLLRFFCEAYRGQEIGEIPDIRLKELFDRYWQKKLESIAERRMTGGETRQQAVLAEEAGTYLLDVAAHMLHHAVRAVSLAELAQATSKEELRGDPASIYGRIRDEFIILEEREHGQGRQRDTQVAFVYEEFMEYAMARSLVRAWDRANLDEQPILREVESLTEKYTSFVQIMGVVVYLALMLKEERDLDLWSLLLKRGERWQATVFEAFRKLPEAQLDNKVFTVLEELLNSEDENLQKQVLDTLKVKRIGNAAPSSLVDPVGQLAFHGSEPVARRAALALGNMSPDLSVPMLLKCVSVRDGVVYGNAQKSLDRMERGSRAVELLIEALGDSDSGVRGVAAGALGQIGDSQAVEPLIVALEDQDWSVRKRVAKALGQIGDPQAIDPLVAGLGEPGARFVADALAQIGGAAVEPLIVGLEDQNRSVRRRAAEALAQIGDPQAIEPLIAILGDWDKDVLRSAVSALRKMEGPQVVESLIAALEDEDAGVRLNVVNALGAIGDAQAVEPLIDALGDDRDRLVRGGAARALGQIGDHRAVDPLINAKRIDTHLVKEAASRALQKIWSRQS